MTRIVALILFVLASASPAVAADARLKRQVLKDCDAASQRVVGLGEGDRQKFADYLARVLALDLVHAPIRPAPLLLPGQGPFEFDTAIEPGADRTWQSFNPLAEYEAKACAVKLVGSLTPESIVALPNLIDLLEDPVAPDELKEQAQETALQVAFESRHAPLVGEAIDAIVELFGRQGDVSEELRVAVLETLGEQALPLLIDRLKECSNLECSPFLDELYRIAPFAAKRFDLSQWRELVHAADASVRVAAIRLAAQPDANPKSVSIAIERLDDTEPEVRAGVFALSRSVLGARKKGAVITPGMVEALVHALGHADPVDRSTAAAVLFEFPDLAKRFQKMIWALCDDQAPEMCIGPLALNHS